MWEFRDNSTDIRVKDIDEGAPSVWKSHAAGNFGIGNLSEEERLVLTSWIERRRALLQRRVQEEIEAELQADDSLLRTSVPFIRAKVHSVGTSKSAPGPSSESALLTIWDPLEDQLRLLQEGAVLEFRDVAARPPYEGLLQLSVSGRAVFRRVDPAFVDAISSDTYRKRSYVDLFEVHLHSRTLEETKGTERRCWHSMDFDTTGILVGGLKESVGGVPGVALYLTDESHLLLRIHFDKLPLELLKKHRMGKLFAQESSSNATTFMDLHMLGFDNTMNCAVARYTKLSSISTAPAETQQRFDEWTRESNQHVKRVASHVRLDLPVSVSGETVPIIGFIIGAKSFGSDTLKIDVDCGTSVEELILPVHLLATAKDGSCSTGFTVSQELRLLEMHKLDFLFRAQTTLWRFDISKLPSKCSAAACPYMVRKVSKVDSNQMAFMY